MSGDNLHGNQPIKFYSEEVTLTKVQLLEKQLSLGDKVSDLDEKHKEWSRKLSGQFLLEYKKSAEKLKSSKGIELSTFSICFFI